MLKLTELSAGYGNQNTIENINLSFDPGKIYTILGKNGCGKSTLLKTCADMLTIHSGTIYLKGKDLKEYQPVERARVISYLAQHRNTPGICVERLLMHGRHPHMSNLKQMRKEDWDKLEEVMELMEIQAFRHKSLGALSGGERQRVYIAMLLAQDTSILLLDEPTTYMDIAYQLNFLELMKKQKSTGKTLIMVLHDLNQALQISDEIILMDRGHVIANGTPNMVLASGMIQQIFGVQIHTIQKAGHPYYQIYLPK